MNATKGIAVARRKKDAPDEPGKAPDWVSLKVDRAIHRKLKMLAAAKDKDLLQYVNEVLQQHLAEEFPRFLRDQS